MHASHSKLIFSTYQAIVFVVGGGNYIEYQNLVDYAMVSFIKCECFIKHISFLKQVFSQTHLANEIRGNPILANEVVAFARREKC